MNNSHSLAIPIINSTKDEKIDPNLDLHSDIMAKAYDGDPSAQLKVGMAYYQNTNIEENCYRAFKWIESSANQGDKEALFRLGDMYALGHGVDQNISYAQELYTDSALQDYPKALIRIYNLYQEDKKVRCRGELDSEEEGMNELEFKKEKNVRELYEYRLDLMQSKNLLGSTIEFYSRMFKSLTESNSKDKDIQRKFGFLYQYGYGIRKIAKRAIEWYTKAAEQNHTNAQYNLGLLYEENTEIKFNYRSAFKWYTLAANGGHSMAQNHLAYFYEKGIAVELDISKALDWYKQAAANNNKGAILNIARINRKGLAGDQNISQSIEWYQKATEQGSATAKNCLHLLRQKKGIAEMDPDKEEDLIDNESSVKNRLCSRLRLDTLNLSNSPDFKKLEKLVSHASVGDGNAMLEVGFKYLNGWVFTKDKEIGFRWIWKAAKTGLVKAQLAIANMYEEGKTDVFQQDYYDDHPTVENISKETKGDVIKQDYYEASIWYSLAAKKKDKVARFKLGMMYYVGHGLRKDPLEASRWFTWSAEQGDSSAQHMLGMLQLQGIALAKDDLEAYRSFEKSAAQKNSCALYQISKILMENSPTLKKEYVKERQTRAIKLCEYSAKINDVDSQLLLAEMHENGDIFEGKNATKALEYYLSAAKNGSLEAKYKAGWMHLNGTGTDRNDIKAFRLIKEAAENNHPEAKSLFAVPIKIQNSTIDYSKILEMFLIVTENGIASLEYNIGYLYEHGLDTSDSNNVIEKDISNALLWYKRAEQQNHPGALYRLGVMNQEGKGVVQNYNIAIYYYNKSFKLKYTESLNALALLHLLGVGVNENVSKAFSLYFEAANLGHLDSRSILAPLYSLKEENRNLFINQKVRGMWEQVANSGNIIMQYRLGEYYENKGDMVSTLKFYELAAQGKVTDAYYKIGMIYEKEGKIQDYSKALNAYQQTKNKNHDEAIYRMAEMYLRGLGVPRNYEKAFQLYNQAAELGNNSARELLDITREHRGNNDSTILITKTKKQEINDDFLTIEDLEICLPMFEYVANQGNTYVQYDLGYLYEMVLKPSNYKKAVEWYSMAELSSHREATYRLGRLYKYGFGIDQDCSKAIKYFEKAMKKKSGGAYFEMGEMYHKGTGVEIDNLQAKKLYLKAAELGDSEAEYTLGLLHEEGKCIAKNILEAFKYYTKAYLKMNINAIKRLTGSKEEEYCKVFLECKRFSIFQWIASRCNEQLVNQDAQFYGNIHYLLGQMYFDRIKKNTADRKTKYDDEKTKKENFKTYFNGKGTKTAEENVCECLNIAYGIYDNKEIIIFITRKIQDIMTSEKADNPQYLEVFKNLDGKLLFDVANVYYNGIQSKSGDTYLLTPNNKIALKLFNESSKKNYYKAEKMIGDIYYYGKDVDTNHEEGRKHHVMHACNQNGEENLQTANKYFEDTVCVSENESNANESIAFIYLVKAEIQQHPDALNHPKNLDRDNPTYIKRNLELHKTFAEQQKSDDNVKAGLLYFQGTNELKKNDKIAEIYFETVENRDDPIAKRFQGDERNRKNSKKFDLHEAEIRYTTSAIKLQGQECFNVGLEYYNGANYVIKNRKTAYIYFYEAKKRNRSKAQKDSGYVNYYGDVQRYLGDMYYCGEGVGKDSKKAKELYEFSAKEFSKCKNYKLGQEYFNGFGDTAKNVSTAIVYLNRAIKQEHPGAGRMLGDIYYYDKTTEEGEKKTLEEILGLYKSSAKFFSDNENYAIGQEYVNKSSGATDSILVAKIYLAKAAEQGNSNAGIKLGDIYCYEDNHEEAMKFYHLSANALQRIQNFSVGQAYLYGSNDKIKNAKTAAIFITKAAEQGHSDAGRCIGDMYYYSDGDGVVRDRKKAMEFYQSSANGQLRNRNYDIGQEYLSGSNGANKNTSIAIIFLSKAAEQGHPDAGRCIADMYYRGGTEITQDLDKAMKFYQSSANGLSRNKNNDIGQEYLNGTKGTTKDPLVALIYLRQAAGQGHPDAGRYLGDMYYHGYGDKVEKDRKKAMEFYQSSAAGLSRNQNFDIAQSYKKGSNNFIKDLSIAIIYFTEAAKKGNPDAARFVGYAYYYGVENVAKDNEKATNFYQLSANQLLRNQNYRNGQTYRSGTNGYTRSIDIALIYLNKAVEQGYPDAGRYLGDMYYYGNDIEQDQEKAKQFYQSSTKNLSRNQNFDIGQTYFHGSQTVKKNTSIAYIYLTKAVEQENHEAEKYLGDIYYYGDGAKEDREKAMELYQSSANGLLRNQNYDIGQTYFNGSNGVNKNTLIATVYLSKAADQGHPGAKRYVADMYYYGNGVEKDHEKAVSLYQSSANGFSENQNFNIGLTYYNGSKDIKKNASTAYIYLTKAAEKEHHEAQRYLGDMYYYGDGVEKDLEEAMKLYQSSANGFSSDKNFSIGQSYLQGSKEVIKNACIAYIYLTKATEQENHEAERYLGDMYYYGEGIDENHVKATELYSLSANGLSSNQNYNVGRAYLLGSKEVIKNTSVAYIYLTKAAEKEHHEAQRYLGDMYYYGDGVEKNQKEAIKLYQSSASGLSSNQNYNIGRVYLLGSKEVIKNASVAYIYLTKATEQENHEAERYLGDMYYNGVYVEKDPKKAIQLYKLSANGLSNNQTLNIGQSYLHGSKDVVKNASVAYIYFTTTTEQENYEAQRYLGDMYYYGDGVEKNQKEAMKRYQLSANGLSNDQNLNIGRVYLYGSKDVIKNASVAHIYLTKAVEQEQYEAGRYLGDMYYYGDGVEKDQVKAMKLYRSSADRLSPEENYNIGRLYLLGSNEIIKNASVSHIYLKKATEQENHEAERYLGDMYYYGEYVEKNYEKATEFYQSSANGLSSNQNYNVGRAYLLGSKEVNKNTSVACIYLKKAAEKEHHEAQRYLGDMYYYGDGVEKDLEEAMKLYQSSANGFSSDKNFSIGQSYLQGSKEVIKNACIAYIYLTKATEQENHEAERYLGDMYYYGEYVEKNHEKATEFYQSSANGLSSEENCNIGQVYLHGSKDTIKNTSAAYIYLTKATEQENHEAERYLGDMYYNGEGTNKDQEKAMQLYQSSANKLFPEKNYEISQAYFSEPQNTKEMASIAYLYLTKAAEHGHPDAKKSLNELKGDKTKQ